MELSSVERATQSAATAREGELSVRNKRESGIAHTPPELARFVARAADDLLRDALGCRSGIADPSVAVVDPACGPGAFLAAALTVAGDRDCVPRSVYAVDNDANALALAQAALDPELTRAAWPFTFRQADTLTDVLPQEIARLAPFLCVLGNPPWIGGAQATSAPFLDALLEDFRRDRAGVRLEERKIGVLADAYVRFVRWACEVARKAERGAVVALVVNGSFLDGPVHRGMRAALLRFFDSLFLVDLGGNALVARSGVRDDNVFGVRPSVAVLIGVRQAGRDEHASSQARYLRLRGPLVDKLERLSVTGYKDASFGLLSVEPPYQRFVPTTKANDDYASWLSLADAMPFHREGVQTNRDSVVVDSDKQRLLARLRAFAAGEQLPELAPAFERLRHYDPERARMAVRAVLARDPNGEHGLLVRRIAYRAFEKRWFAPIAPLCHRPRKDLLNAMDHSQFALVTVRKDRGDLPWAHFAAADAAIDNCLLSTRSSCRARAFPTHDPSGRENLAPAVASALAGRLGRTVDSSELCCYALAVLASSSYRARHGEALRIDYPRIPWPSDRAQFDALCRSGRELVKLFCSSVDKGEGERILAEQIAEIDRL